MAAAGEKEVVAGKVGVVAVSSCRSDLGSSAGGTVAVTAVVVAGTGTPEVGTHGDAISTMSKWI